MTSANHAFQLHRRHIMKYRSIARAGTVAIGVALAACAFAQGAAKLDPIKIGAPLPLSGALAFPGQGEQVGLKLAQAEINAHGGVNGRHIEFVIVDSRSTPDGALAAVTRLVAQDKVVAVLNGGSSGEVNASLPFFRQNGVVNYAISAVDPTITDPFTRNIFRGATLNNKYSAPLYADYLAKSGVKRLGILQGAYPLYLSLMQPLNKELEKAGIEVAGVVQYNLGDTNFGGQALQLASLKADAVLVLAQASDVLTILPQLRRGGVTARLVGDTASADPAILGAGAAVADFTTFSMGGPQLVHEKTGEMGRFHAALAQYKIELAAKTPNFFSVLAYSDAYVLAEALRKVDGPITSDALIKSLETNIRGFLPGTTPEFAYAAKIGRPRTFSASNHDGNTGATPITVKNGQFVSANSP
jgi:branched-chain amino acid transport system substrate-binding protein